MNIKKCLDYQKQFFTDFAQAWQKRSDLDLYQMIDTTAKSLRLEVSEVPAYILAYDKEAQNELEAYLQKGLTHWLRQDIPFFEIDARGVIMFGDWYHRRQFGRLDVWNRQMIQNTPNQQQILPELERYASDSETYLEDRLQRLHDELFTDVKDLEHDLERAQTAAETAQTEVHSRISRERPQPQNGTGRLKSLFGFGDEPEEQPEPVAPVTPAPSKPVNTTQIMDLKNRLRTAKSDAEVEFDDQKRQIEVEVAVIRYEYQAIMNHYSSIEQFENALAHISESYLAALSEKGADQDA
ncbi:hypothetical protein [Loigolactobacillus bifermentans]|jgi:hypothetical protein|uniref:Exonuclease SbcC n=1 Tax=Loigolactobacillus bifermentans DSM 20003 TaxID=1423726 RepID=A0A0R1GQL9_9LACO|nr:hypothetical protein [Loigolactobacillus bifermentans]KRK33207.1 hypothetical protein FC07_GL001462 [Loigolactobacillus bifermentans DSM 20003]QGG60553.1 hypothetical protein LB003_08805 [Loigolactobacillus bifermentans]